MIREYYNDLYETKNKISIIEIDPIIMKVNNFLTELECKKIFNIINIVDNDKLNILDNSVLFDLFKRITLLLKIPGNKIDQYFKKNLKSDENKDKINIIIFLQNSNNDININYDSKKKTLKEEIGKLLIIDNLVEIDNINFNNKLFLSYSI